MPKTQRVFYPRNLTENARANVAKYSWAAEIQKQIEASAQPWMRFSDDELWDMMFGSKITRSWMVWSDGYCPSCKNDVRMYSWVMDALNQPWKVRCPRCNELFPKNDFHQYYRSGFDDRCVFDPERADRSLLFNIEHPDPEDPLNKFGVDDGEGYVEGDKRWRFIGAYLIYGQWKQAVLGGIKNLASAYLVTGNADYAHKAGVLLDRVADLYPEHDFGKEGLVYEQPGRSGYVSTWHDACEETRELVMAYDMVFDALQKDKKLVDFLSRKAKQSEKSSFDDIQRNIETRILQDALNNEDKIYSNYPRTEITRAVIKTVLDWHDNRDEVYKLLDAMIKKATAVDGVTGEKGLAGYSAYTIQGLAMILGEYARIEPDFLEDMLNRHQQLHQTFRFFIDTWCFGKYYPLSGDTGSFARKIESYVGAPFSRGSGLSPSMYALMWDLYRLTGDAAFVQVLYHENGDSLDCLPRDLFADDPDTFQREVEKVIAREGRIPEAGSINKQQWHIAILRSGQGTNARALWLDYDSGGGHGHADGMNLGLFAKGIDLMPDFGYPPVQYGGWGSPKSVWYTMTASHNTVVVDGQNHSSAAGKTTLWADGERFRAIRASGAELIEGSQFERTAAMIDISDRDFYVVDIFRVSGGRDHAKFMHSHFGQITTQGLSLSPTDDYGHNTQMRSFIMDPDTSPGWSVDWKIEDRYKYLPPGSDVHLRYTDLTNGAQAIICEAWISPGGYEMEQGTWIPRAMVRRQSEKESLASTFISIIEPYEGAPKITSIRRLSLEFPDGKACAESDVAIEIQLADGSRDIIIAIDAENPTVQADFSVSQTDTGIYLRGEMCMVRLDKEGKAQSICLCRGDYIRVREIEIKLDKGTEFAEINCKGK